MRDPKKLIAALVAGLGVLGLVFFLANRKGSAPKGASTQQQDRTSGEQVPCPGKEMILEMKDPYMKGVIEKGQKFKVILNWYACNPVERGDFVLYRFSETLDPVVKIVKAVPGDRYDLVRDKAHNAWNLKVNGELVTSEGKPHFFGGEQPPTLSLYHAPRKGVLQPRELIVLSSWAPGDSDSSIFGLTNLQDILGKVEPIK